MLAPIVWCGPWLRSKAKPFSAEDLLGACSLLAQWQHCHDVIRVPWRYVRPRRLRPADHGVPQCMHLPRRCMGKRWRAAYVCSRSSGAPSDTPRCPGTEACHSVIVRMRCHADCAVRATHFGPFREALTTISYATAGARPVACWRGLQAVWAPLPHGCAGRQGCPVLQGCLAGACLRRGGCRRAVSSSKHSVRGPHGP